MSVDLKTFIKRALVEKRNIEIGKFNLLNLNDIRDNAGEAWPKLKKRIFDAGAHFIEKRIGPDDAVIVCNEGFLLLFADPGVDIADEVAAIAADMKSFFLGQPDLAGLKLETETLQADAQGVGKLVAAVAAPVAAVEDTPKPVAPPKPPAAKIPPDLKAYFRPIWDAERQMIAANFCFTKVNVEGRWSEFRNARKLRMTQREHGDADTAALTMAIQALRMAMQKKQKQTFALGVHVDTLDDRDARAEWTGSLTALPEAARKRFWIRIDDLPEHPKQAAPYLSMIRELGVTLVGERPFGEFDVDGFEEMGISLFSTTVRPPSNAESEGILDHELKTLNGFARAARSLQASTFVDDIREARTFKDVMSTGVRFMAGKDVLREAGIPAPLRPFSMVDLARLANAA